MGKRPGNSPSVQETQQQILTLEDCYRLALPLSEDVAIQREEVKKTAAQFYKATGAAIGDVDFVATDFFQQDRGGGASGDGSVGSTFTSTERRERSFQFSQPIFQGFRTLGAVAGAGSLRGQRKKERERAEELLFLDVAAAFYTLLRFEKDVETTEGIHQLFEERINELNEREKIGRSRASEVATALARMKIIEADLARARGALQIARQNIYFFTGITPQAIKLQETNLPKDIPVLDAVLTAVEERPDVEAARQARKTAWQAVIVAQSEFWPTIDLDAKHYEKREGFQNGIDWDALFTIDIPIFKGGETFGEFKETVSEWRQAKLAYSRTRREADLEIRQRYEDMISSLKESEALDEAVKAAQENFRLQKEEYDRNLVNNLDVLEALQTFFETSKQSNVAYYTMKENYWRFQSAIGNRPDGSIEMPAGPEAATGELP